MNVFEKQEAIARECEALRAAKKHDIFFLIDAMMTARQDPSHFEHTIFKNEDGIRVECAKFGRYNETVLTIVSGRPERPTQIECEIHTVGVADDTRRQRSDISLSLSNYSARQVSMLF